MPSYSSGDGTYGVSRSSVQATASVPVMSPLAPATRMAFRLLPRNPLIRYTNAVVRDRRRDRIHRQPGGVPDRARPFRGRSCGRGSCRARSPARGRRARRRAAWPRYRSRRASAARFPCRSARRAPMMNDPAVWSHTTTSRLPYSAGVLPSPNWLRMRLSPRSVCQSGVPFMSYA